VQKTCAVDQNPADTESKSQIEVLQQVQLFQANFFLSSVFIISCEVWYGAGDYYVCGRFITQLQDLARNTVSVAPALPSMPLPLPLPQPAYNQLPLTIMPIANVSADAISSALSALISQPPTITPVVAPLAQKVMPPVPDVSQLFVAAGLISDDGSAILSGAAQYKMTHLILSLSLSLSQLQLIPS
jgi:hypothetical protein